MQQVVIDLFLILREKGRIDRLEAKATLTRLAIEHIGGNKSDQELAAKILEALREDDAIEVAREAVRLARKTWRLTVWSLAIATLSVLIALGAWLFKTS